MMYFRWTFNNSVQQGQFLGGPLLPSGEPVDGWRFTTCKPYMPSESVLQIPIKEAGEAFDVSFGAFNIIYASDKIVNAILNCSTDLIEVIPARIAGTTESVFIINPLVELKCIDESKSKFQKWEIGNAARPDKAGQYKMVMDLKVDPNIASGHDIFRPWGWNVSVIVSEKLMTAIKNVGQGDTVFEPVLSL